MPGRPGTHNTTRGAHVTTKTIEYPYIRAWGARLGSYAYFIDEQVEKARTLGAPANAIYQRSDGTWRTADDITDPGTREELDAIVEKMK